MKGHMSRVRRTLCGDSGFTLVEAVVALFILAIMMLALAMATISGYRALRVTRGLQQATALGNKGVESAREITYDGLVMSDADLVGDSRIVSVCPGLTGSSFFDPDGSGPLECEEIVSSPSGVGINPHVTTSTIDNQTFTASRYVTWVDEETQGGPGQSYKRLVVIVEWNVNGETKRYQTSTLITRARRGLPVPKFELSPADQALQVAPGAQVVFAQTVRNLGVLDTYDLDMPAPPLTSWAIELYEDVLGDGQYQPGTDTPLVDTNGNGVVDTGSVTTDQVFHFLAVWTLSPSEPTSTSVMTLTATSGANSDFSHEATDTLRVRMPGLTLYLHNDPSPPTGNTTAQAAMDMTIDAPTPSTLYKYSTNYYGGDSGRYVAKKATTHSESSTQYMANWVYQVPENNTQILGNGELKIWAGVKAFACDKSVTFTAYLREKNSAATNVGTLFATGTGTTSCGFEFVTVAFPGLDRTFAMNKWIELKVTVDNNSDDDGLFAYDTLDYESWLYLPKVSS